MKTKWNAKLMALLTCLIFGGCASFEPGLRYQELMRPRVPTVKETSEGVDVSVEEFATASKSRFAFDADLASYGVLALLVRLENNGAENYHVHQNDIRAMMSGQSLPLLSAIEAANKAVTSEYVGKALAWTLATGPFFILFWPATIAGSSSHTQSVNKRIQEYFEALSFNGTLLKPNQVATGFLYFRLPDGVKKLENLSLELQISEERTGNRPNFKLSLPSLDVSG